MASESMKAKIVLLGDGGVGKTSLIRRFVVDQYSDEYITTIGTKVSKRSLSLGHPAAEVEMAMQIWDVLGQKGYSGVQETAMKGPRACSWSTMRRQKRAVGAWKTIGCPPCGDSPAASRW